jgi:hypothetical protein
MFSPAREGGVERLPNPQGSTDPTTTSGSFFRPLPAPSSGQRPAPRRIAHKPAQSSGADRPAIRRNSPVTRIPHFAYPLKTKDFASLPRASLTPSACSPAVSWRREEILSREPKLGLLVEKKFWRAERPP